MSDAIRHIVNTNQGVKGVELALKVMSLINPQKFQQEEFFRELNRLVAEGELVEIEYVLPIMEYRIKSMYFPKGTKVEIKVQNRVNA